MGDCSKMTWKILPVIVFFYLLIPAIKAYSAGVSTYNFPESYFSESGIKLRADGIPVNVFTSSAGDYASFVCTGKTEIEILLPEGTTGEVQISPLKNNIIPEVSGNSLKFNIPGPILLAVMVNDLPCLYLYANPPETNKPDPSDPGIIFFKAGQVHDAGLIEMTSGQTLYIEGGAVVRGAVHAVRADNIKISGHGILDGSYFKPVPTRSVLLECCKNAIIEEIIMIEPTSWMILLGGSENITVRRVKQLGSVSTTDGVDVVGSKRVKVQDCFLRNGDDCVAIKAFDFSRYDKKVSNSFAMNVEDVEVRGCILLSYLGGHAFEIGHELTTDSVKNIRYIDCDVLGVHGYGGVFGMNNTDRAVISGVLYENIRVEHYYNKLVNLRIVKSRYYRDEKRGKIENVVFRNIDVRVSRYNPGYSVSLIGGYDKKHQVKDVRFENFRMNGKPVTSPDEMDLFIKQAAKIVFR